MKKEQEGVSSSERPDEPDGSSRQAVILESDRDRRVWSWIVKQVGLEAAQAAQLAGGRKRYPSNLAKALGLAVPSDLEITPRSDARKHIEALRRIVRGG